MMLNLNFLCMARKNWMQATDVVESAIMWENLIAGETTLEDLENAVELGRAS